MMLTRLFKTVCVLGHQYFIFSITAVFTIVYRLFEAEVMMAMTDTAKCLTSSFFHLLSENLHNKYNQYVLLNKA